MKPPRVLIATGLSIAMTAMAFAQTPAPKIAIVSATGCLTEQSGGNWMLTSATDPVPSSAGAPPAEQRPAKATLGKGQFKLIGVSEFDLPSHKDQAAVVKGLLIKGAPVDRINITSVTAVPGACGAAPK